MPHQDNSTKNLLKRSGMDACQGSATILDPEECLDQEEEARVTAAVAAGIPASPALMAQADNMARELVRPYKARPSVRP